ncbi:MAG: nucleoside transporter C-terminal domain-containing protein [Pseudomonadales bacterium]
MQALLGILLILAMCYLFSQDRKRINWRPVLAGLVVQSLLILLLFKVPLISQALLSLNVIVETLEAATRTGAIFLFGFLGGAEAPFVEKEGVQSYLLAFRVLPQILMFAVIVAILWYYRVLQWLVRGLGLLMQRSMGISGALGTGAAASLFLGMVEAPMVVRAYLKEMSESEFFILMTCGMSTIAGTMMVLYASVLSPIVPGVVGHLLSASIINIIGAVYLSRLLMPGSPETSLELPPTLDLKYESLMDAISRGTQDGLNLALQIGAMLLVLNALVALVNILLGQIDLFGKPLSLELIMGWILAPIAFVIGIPWSEAVSAGGILGTKLILNEFIGYLQMVAMGDALSDRTQLILTYALCSFANLGSLGILVGGLGVLVPERRGEILSAAPKSILSGTLVTLMTASLVALLSSL